MIEFHVFGMPIKTLGSLGKIRVGRVTGNTHICFLALLIHAQIVGATELTKIIVHSFLRSFVFFLF